MKRASWNGAERQTFTLTLGMVSIAGLDRVGDTVRPVAGGPALDRLWPAMRLPRG